MTEDTPRRVVRLDELTPDQRRLVLALIDAQSAACADGHHVMVNGVCKYATAHTRNNIRRSVERSTNSPQ